MNILFGLVVVALGVGVCAYSWFMRQLANKIEAGDSKIASAGVDGQAEVIDHRSMYSRSGPAYYITFEYTIDPAGGKPYKIRREASITGEDYGRISPGAKVAIRYLPEAPNNVILLEGAGEQMAPTFLTGSTWGLVIGAIIIVIGIVFALR